MLISQRTKKPVYLPSPGQWHPQSRMEIFIKRCEQQLQHTLRYAEVGGSWSATMDATSTFEFINREELINRRCALLQFCLKHPQNIMTRRMLKGLWEESRWYIG
jgi:hypothetical protein